MKLKNKRSFTVVFFIIVTAELICTSIESLSQFHYVTKPSILFSLIIFFWINCNHLDYKTKNFALLALMFSLLGDMLLMFENFFVGGLLAFLLAHIMYILVFIRYRNENKNPLPFIFILLVYSSGLFFLLKDGLDKMLIPVIFYMVVIFSMATLAFLRKERVTYNSYNLVFYGAIFFIISDSLLALNRFYEPLFLSNIWIMFTYSLAQYLIVMGILRQQE